MVVVRRRSPSHHHERNQRTGATDQRLTSEARSDCTACCKGVSQSMEWESMWVCSSFRAPTQTIRVQTSIYSNADVRQASIPSCSSRNDLREHTSRRLQALFGTKIKRVFRFVFVSQQWKTPAEISWADDPLSVSFTTGMPEMARIRAVCWIRNASHFLSIQQTHSSMRQCLLTMNDSLTRADPSHVAEMSSADVYGRIDRWSVFRWCVASAGKKLSEQNSTRAREQSFAAEGLMVSSIGPRMNNKWPMLSDWIRWMYEFWYEGDAGDVSEQLF